VAIYLPVLMRRRIAAEAAIARSRVQSTGRSDKVIVNDEAMILILHGGEWLGTADATSPEASPVLPEENLI
jgi:hypothetical protein